MKISSPPGLHYPITVLELHKQTDAPVQRSDRLFTYYYESNVTECDKWGDEKTVKKRFPTQFNASTEGSVVRWAIKPGTVITRPGVELLEIEEPCTHEIQFGGLCAECGKDMTTVDYLTKERNVDRATVNMTHDNVALLVSHKEAVRGEEETKKRLLGAKKLTLIVDLDQTVIHTTCERTIAEWKADPNNPNHDAVKDVEGFQLADDNVSNVAANWYYVKMRPGLKDFFDRISTKYEMHVYTMATRAYAQEVARIIDPERKYFGDRILSRDENYTDKLKSLQRLFYQNTAMVVIIDDRADVWQYSPHLVRVPVFNFFPGAGDINASFLPKQQELVTSKKVNSMPPVKKPEDGPPPATSNAGDSGVAASTSSTESANGVPNELEQQLLSMATGDGSQLLEQQAKEQERVIIAQQTERPLLQKQLMLDKQDEETEDVEESAEVTNGHAQHAEHAKHRHSILHDDDRGLEIIEANLNRVHREFYDEYTKTKGAPAGGRVAELKGERSPKKRALNDSTPDVAELMPRIKEEVLDGAVVVFSGIIPLGVDVQSSDFALWIKSFGAEVATSINRRTTHVIANPDRKTTKVKKAARYEHIKIVNPEWMFQCCSRWEHLDETPYLIELDPAERTGSPFADDDSINATGDEDGEELAESPVTLDLSANNWESVDDEFDEFMNETDTDGENESESDSGRSDNSANSKSGPNKKKRKRTNGLVDTSEAEESDSSTTSTSRLQRRKKRTMERVTSLTNVVAAEKSSGLPSPDATGPEEGQGDDEEGASGGKDGQKGEGKGEERTEEEIEAKAEEKIEDKGEAPDLQEDYDDGLEAELLAGFGDSDDDEE